MREQWHHQRVWAPYGHLDRAGTPGCRRFGDELVRRQRRAQFRAASDGGRSSIACAYGVGDRVLAVELDDETQPLRQEGLSSTWARAAGTAARATINPDTTAAILGMFSLRNYLQDCDVDSRGSFLELERHWALY
jgi:hypothetical protein